MISSTAREEARGRSAMSKYLNMFDGFNMENS